MKKLSPLLFAVLLMVSTANAQKPKSTFDHETFGKKVVLNMNVDVTTYSPKDEDLKYMATAMGKPLEELTAQNETNKTQLKEDVAFLDKNGIYRILDKTEVQVTQESPIKIADIILYCHYKDRSYTLTLTNCVQTNTTWVLGDGIEPKGDGIADLIAGKKAKEEKHANSGFAKFAASVNALESDAEKKDSSDRRAAAASSLTARITAAKSGTLPKGYQAKLFPVQSNTISGRSVEDPSSVYFHKELVDQYLPGYYIDRLYGKTVYVDRINYAEPFTLMTQGPVIEPTPSVAPKDLSAFYVGDQLFVQLLPGTQIKVTGMSLGDAPTLTPWVILISEGAIRKVVYIHQNSGEIVGMKSKFNTADQVFQKLDGNVVTTQSLNLHFKKVMAELVSENAEMAAKITNGAKGYMYMDYENIILEFNRWYDKQYPGKVKYVAAGPAEAVDLVPMEDDFVSISTKEDLTKYLGAKAWETAAVTSYNPKTGRIAQASLLGVPRVKAASKYSSYNLLANGDVELVPTPGKWDAVDGKTFNVNANGSNRFYNITNVTTSTFTADVKRDGGQVETVIFRVQKGE